MAFAGSVRPAEMSVINITPLVDVMLVLLIIFMVAAPLLSRTLALDLGNVPPDTTRKPQVIEVAIAADGAISVDGAALPEWMLASAFAAAREQAATLPSVQVQVAPEVRYEQVAQVLAMARNSGIEAIGVSGD